MRVRILLQKKLQEHQKEDWQMILQHQNLFYQVNLKQPKLALQVGLQPIIFIMLLLSYVRHLF